MTLDELLTDVVRVYLDDLKAPFLWSDDFLTAAANRAEQEAAIRTLCLFDSETADVCEITLESGIDRYAVDPRVVMIDAVYYAGTLLEQVDPVAMDRLYGPLWRPAAGAPVSWYARDLRAVHLTSAPGPDENGESLALGVYRLPLQPMTALQDSPEVPAWMHRALAHWICAEAYLIVDADNQRPDLSKTHRDQFDDYFGPSVAATVQLSQRRTPRPLPSLTAPYPTMLHDVQRSDWNGRASDSRSAQRG